MRIFFKLNFVSFKSPDLVPVHHGEKKFEKFYKKIENSRISAKN